jgi:hypothetical protein
MARKPQTKAKAKAKKPLKKGAAFRPKEAQIDETPIPAKVMAESEVIDAEEVSPEETTKLGRPTKYKPEFALIAKALCRRGATDYELAEEFGVVTSTIWRWQCQYEDFCKAVETGKGSFDRRIERALAQRAAGYTYHTEKVFQFQGEIIRARVVEHMPADVGAAKLWLTNRDPENWREATQRIEHGQPGDFDTMSDEDLKNYILSEQEMLQESKRVSRGKPSTKH